MKKLLTLLFLSTLLSGCVSTKSVKVAREIQQKNGYRTHSLWYHGSTKEYHYFSQKQQSSIFNDGNTWFKVPYYELYVNDKLLFLYGQKKNIKVRISSEQPYLLTRRKDKLPGKLLKDQVKKFPNTINAAIRKTK